MSDQHEPRRAYIPLLWLVGGAAVFLASWLGPNLAHLHRGGLFSMSPFFHYGLSVGIWFLAFAGGYLLIERLQLPFGRTAAWAHFGLMTSGAALIIAPSVALAWLPDSATAAAPVSLFRWMNAVSLVGYALTLLALLVFVGALGWSVWARMTPRRTRPSAG